MAAAYVIVQMKISDMERFKVYMAAAPPTVQAAGGEYIVRGGRHETLEDNFHPERVTVLKFPTYQHAKDWYDGENYRHVRALREGTTEYFRMELVEGVDAPQS